MKISLVILTCNEMHGLKALFHRIPRQSVDEIFAVDWNSTDGSIEFLEKNDVKVLRQTMKGRGEAFRMAFAQAQGDALIFFSPDGNEMPEDIPKFRPFLENGADIVIGNRMSDGGYNEEDGELLKFRKWANQGFTLIANVVWNRGKYVHDTINGFRAIRRSAWNSITPDGSGYTIEYQTSIRAFKRKLVIKEFPTHEGSRIEDRVGSPSIPTGMAFVKLFFAECFHGSSKPIR